MTEFEKWWFTQEKFRKEDGLDGFDQLDPIHRQLAEKAWHAAQCAVLRTIAEPPYIPKPGDKVRFLGLCHPLSLGKIKEVTEVTKETIPVYWVGTRDAERDTYSSGILSEVEKVDGHEGTLDTL